MLMRPRTGPVGPYGIVPRFAALGFSILAAVSWGCRPVDPGAAGWPRYVRAWPGRRPGHRWPERRREFSHDEREPVQSHIRPGFAAGSESVTRAWEPGPGR